MARLPTPHPPQQQLLPMDLPAPQPEEQDMRALFEQRWALWHRARTFEEAVADATTRRLLELAVQRGRRHALMPGGRR